MTVERGCLVLADITGYTKYLSGVELDHSQDILADLLGVVVTQLRGGLDLAKLEGDAVFCYDRDSDLRTTGGSLVTLVEGTYFAFQERLRNIRQLTTCTCDACRHIPWLNLKFLVHHGEFVLHEIAGSRELLGPDVILAHRLLKNSVSESTGLNGYALFTRACVERFRLLPEQLGLKQHRETYDGVGEVEGFVQNLERRWREEEQRRVVYVDRGAPIEVEQELPAPPPVVWEYMTSPEKRARWQPGTLRVDQENPRGVPGVGSTNHCVHGEDAVVEEILDWKPFRYVTVRAKGSFGTALNTIELSPLSDETTLVSYRMAPEVTSEVDPMPLEEMKPLKSMVEMMVRTGLDTIDTMLRRAGERSVVPPAAR